MRHLNSGRKFGRSPAQRKAMFRSLAMNLILRERVLTTDAKAKEMRRVADKLVTVAKRADAALGVDASKLGKTDREKRLSVYREIRSFLPWDAFDDEGAGVDVVGKLLDEIAPRYRGRSGGYTRIMKAGRRRGDNAPLSVIEWVPAAARKEKAEKKGTRGKESAVKKVSRFFKRSKKETAGQAGK